MKFWHVRTLVIAACCAAWPTAAVPFRQIRLPTAADGEITYLITAGTKKPVRAQDDRAEVVAVGFMLVPQGSDQRPRWTIQYSLRFKGGAQPASIAVYVENPDKGHLDVRDDSPTLHGDFYTTMSAPKTMDEGSFEHLTADRTWTSQSKFVIRYADGVERTLHQLSVLSHAERMALLKTVTSTEPSPPSGVQAFDERPWKVGYKAGGQEQGITEYVLPGQTAEAWRELITRQQLSDPGRKLSPDAVADRIKATLARDCPSLNWQVLRQSDGEMLYQWSHEGCGSYPAQVEIAKLRRTEHGICHWAYASKDMPVTPAMVDSWRPLIDRLACD